MEESAVGRITEHFGKVSDPRVGNATPHKLIDIIVIAICAVVCGADGWSDVTLFGRSKQNWFRRFLELLHDIPSHDTFGRVFGLVDPEEFRRSFLEWVQAIQKLTKGEVIAIDGKQLHGSRDEGNGQAALNMVSAWATANQLVLGQVKVDDKSNEIPAIPRLLELLDITGCLVTIDAIGTQTEIARTIVDQGGDYLLPVKENQGQLYENLEKLFGIEEQEGFTTSGYTHARKVDNKHGRLEVRECWATSSVECRDYLRSRRSNQSQCLNGHYLYFHHLRARAFHRAQVNRRLNALTGICCNSTSLQSSDTVPDPSSPRRPPLRRLHILPAYRSGSSSSGRNSGWCSRFRRPHRRACLRSSLGPDEC